MIAERNYIRLYSLSWNSMEVYMLILLMIIFLCVAIIRKEDIVTKLIYMYIFALPYTDRVYRLGDMQICELIIVAIIVVDILSKKMKIPHSPLIHYMIGFSLILWASSIISIASNIYTRNEYGIILTPSYSIRNNIRFTLMTYMVARIIIKIKEDEELLGKIVNVLRMSGNLNAAFTILQVLLFEAGFTVPGIFYMWDFPRAKGLSHEPATNAFVLFTTIALTTIYLSNGKYKVHIKSLILQAVAFLFCFSSGAIPVIIVYFVLFFMISSRKARINRKQLTNIMIGFTVFVVGFAFIQTMTSLRLPFDKVFNKVQALINDYLTGGNTSGRGGDAVMLQRVMANNPVFGVGAFNAIMFFPNISNTNEYIVLLCELGIAGMCCLIPITVYFMSRISHFTNLSKKTYGINYIAFVMTSILVIAWLKVLFFHQIWLEMALLFSTAQNEKLPDSTQVRTGY